MSYNISIFKTKPTGTLKAETALLDWLNQDKFFEITPDKIRLQTGVRLESIKKIINLYTNEIQQYYKKHNQEWKPKKKRKYQRKTIDLKAVFGAVV